MEVHPESDPNTGSGNLGFDSQGAIRHRGGMRPQGNQLSKESAMSDKTTRAPTPASQPSAKSGATFLGFLDKYAPAEELYETLRKAVLESQRDRAGIEDPPTEAG